MTAAEKAELEKSQKDLTASIKKCKKLQKEKRSLETRLEDVTDCKRAHIQAGHEFAPGKRFYGTLENVQELADMLAHYPVTGIDPGSPEGDMTVESIVEVTDGEITNVELVPGK